MANVKFSTGPKSAIDEQIATGTIDNGDIVLTSDTDELIFVNTKSEKKVIKSKSQKDYVLNGTSLGDLKDGSVLKAGLSIDDLLEILTKKSIPVEYVAPEINLSHNGIESRVLEAGTPIALILKSKFIQNDAGDLNAHSILKNGVVIYEKAANSLETAVDAFILGDEEVVFSSKVLYKDGVVKKNNLGELDFENSIKAGVIRSKNISLVGKRPVFYGAFSDEKELNSENIKTLNSSLELEKGSVFTIPIQKGQKEIVFAYPASLGEVEQISYIEMNDNMMALNFTKSSDLIGGVYDYNPIEYNIYSYSMLVPAAAPMTFKVTI